MKLNNRGFSLVELLGVMVILGIILAAAVAQYRKHVYDAVQESYDIMAESLQSAADNYFMDHPLDESVTAETLVEEGYIEQINDPSRKADSDDICQAKIRRKTDEIQENSEALAQENMAVSVCCKDYEYTFKYPSEEKSKDKYCKANPYDITKIDNIKVLNVYPNKTYANNVSEWLTTYGKGLINVTPVYIADFNASPESYLGKDKAWNYDEIVFGFSDCNNNRDLSNDAAKLVDKFLSDGGAAIFGHDTITKGCSAYDETGKRLYGGHKYFVSLQDHVNIEATTDLQFNARSNLTIQKEGIFTSYPYQIGKINDKLVIKNSHVYGQVAKGDVWITFDDISTPEKSIYLSTWGNNAFIQTGHTNGSATDDEKKIIANIVFYMVAKQYSED